MTVDRPQSIGKNGRISEPTTDDGSDPAPPENIESASAPTIRMKVVDFVEQRRRQFESMRKQSLLVDKSATILARPRYTLDTIASGYIALRLFVLLFPIAYLIVAGIGLYANHSAAAAKSISESNGLNGALAESIASAANGSSHGKFFAIVFGTVAALWAARALLKALRISHSIAWRLPDAKYKAVDLGPIVVTLGTVTMMWLGGLANRLHDSEGVPPLLGFGAFGTLVAVLWFLAARHLPHAECRWWYLVPGSILVGVGAAALSIAVKVYFAPKLARASETYGTVGAGLVLVTFGLAIGWLVVLSAELNAGIFEMVTGTAEGELDLAAVLNSETS